MGKRHDYVLVCPGCTDQPWGQLDVIARSTPSFIVSELTLTLESCASANTFFLTQVNSIIFNKFSYHVDNTRSNWNNNRIGRGRHNSSIPSSIVIPISNCSDGTTLRKLHSQLKRYYIWTCSIWWKCCFKCRSECVSDDITVLLSWCRKYWA